MTVVLFLLAITAPYAVLAAVQRIVARRNPEHVWGPR